MFLMDSKNYKLNLIIDYRDYRYLIFEILKLQCQYYIEFN